MGTRLVEIEQVTNGFIVRGMSADTFETETTSVFETFAAAAIFIEQMFQPGLKSK